MIKNKVIVGTVIVVYLVCMVYVGYYFATNKAPAKTFEDIDDPFAKRSEPEEKPKQIEKTEPVKPVDIEYRDYSDQEVEEIKMDIITGQQIDTPIDMEESKTDLIKEYIKDCHGLYDLELELDCFLVYYRSNDDEFISQINACEDSDCRDQVYYDYGLNEKKAFCTAIENEELKSECIGIIQ